ncbi:MAG: Sir2 family NAD-dependent protein deacetylase [Nocardioides sp.]
MHPNAAHAALARLEAAMGEDLLLVTQNVDDLHERAGSTRVLHMHGRLLSALCTECGGRSPWSGPLGHGPACPICAAQALGRMWSGSARCRTVWTTSTTPSRRRRCSRRSAPRGRSTPRPAS